MTRIGLLCEGETDRIAIEWYIRKSLVQRGFTDIEFGEIRDHTDQTSRDIHGWTMVLAWLSQEPGRRQKLLRDIFANSSSRKYDAIVVHLDADNLSMSEFRQHVLNHYNMTVNNAGLPQKRGFEIRRIIMSVGKLDESSPAYAIGVAVESTETWCLSSFRNISGDPETISGNALDQQFMDALLKFEKRPPRIVSNATKTSIRWERFCRHPTATRVNRIERQCFHYRRLVSDVLRVLG